MASNGRLGFSLLFPDGVRFAFRAQQEAGLLLAVYQTVFARLLLEGAGGWPSPKLIGDITDLFQFLRSVILSVEALSELLS